MDADTLDDASAPNNDVQASEVEVEVESNNVDSLEVMSSSGDIMRELESTREVLTRVELDLACRSEKLLNLEILVMHVAARESDFEAFVLEKEGTFSDSAEKALEFDLLSGILESELNEEGKFLVNIRMEIDSAFTKISSCKYLEEFFREMQEEMQEKLNDSGKSLKQSLEELSEMRLQSDNFNRILSSFAGGKNDKDLANLKNDYFSDMSSKIRMQTAEQQRHILRMLEKSLARELDLEKKLTELRQSEDLLKLSLQQELFFIEEEVEVTWERLFEAENASEILLGKSKELISRLQMAQFNLNGSIQREGELKSKYQEFNEQFKVKDSALRNSESINTELREKVNSLEKLLEESKLQVLNQKDSAEQKQETDSKIHEMENLICCLREKVSEAEHRAESAEAECKLLRHSNMELSKDLNLVMTSHSSTLDKVNLLERQLRESDVQLQHAVASTEASAENQTMLYSMIKDMENLINNLKSKVAKAESQTESAEEKCIILSEANSDLSEELNFVRSRMEYLETSLHQTEGTKKATAKDISVQTKLITDLVVQLALERERLNKQISLLTKEKRVLLKQLQQTSENHSVDRSNGIKGSIKDATSVEETKGETTELLATSHEISLLIKEKMVLLKQLKQKSEDHSVDKSYGIKGSMKDVISVEETEEETTELSATSHEPEMAKGVPMGKAEMGLSDSTTECDTTRNMDTRLFNSKYILGAIFVFFISAFVASLLQHQGDQL